MVVDILKVAAQNSHSCPALPVPFTKTYVYDDENRLKSRTEGGGTTSYYYDANGALAKKVEGSSSTIYVGGIFVSTGLTARTRSTTGSAADGSR